MTNETEEEDVDNEVAAIGYASSYARDFFL